MFYISFHTNIVCDARVEPRKRPITLSRFPRRRRRVGRGWCSKGTCVVCILMSVYLWVIWGIKIKYSFFFKLCVFPSCFHSFSFLKFWQKVLSYPQTVFKSTFFSAWSSTHLYICPLVYYATDLPVWAVQGGTITGFIIVTNKYKTGLVRNYFI